MEEDRENVKVGFGGGGGGVGVVGNLGADGGQFNVYVYNGGKGYQAENKEVTSFRGHDDHPFLEIFSSSQFLSWWHNFMYPSSMPWLTLIVLLMFLPFFIGGVVISMFTIDKSYKLGVALLFAHPLVHIYCCSHFMKLKVELHCKVNEEIVNRMKIIGMFMSVIFLFAVGTSLLYGNFLSIAWSFQVFVFSWGIFLHSFYLEKITICLADSVVSRLSLVFSRVVLPPHDHWFMWGEWNLILCAFVVAFWFVFLMDLGISAMTAVFPAQLLTFLLIVFRAPVPICILGYEVMAFMVYFCFFLYL